MVLTTTIQLASWYYNYQNTLMEADGRCNSAAYIPFPLFTKMFLKFMRLLRGYSWVYIIQLCAA
jgi:hypothetical protein